MAAPIESKHMTVFEYTPEEDEESFHQADSRYRDFKKPSEDVTDAVLTPSEAFENFAGKVFTPNGGGDKQKPSEPVFLARPTDQKETPLQRYERLQAEMAQFEKDLATLSKSDSDISTLLTKELSCLQNDLKTTASDPKIAPFLQANYPLRSQHITAKNVGSALTAQLKDYQQQQHEVKSKMDADAKTDHSGGGLSYELYLANYENNDVSNLTALDARLHKLEKIIGLDNSRLPACFPDIVSGIAFLQKSISAVKDPSKLDPILRKMRTLTGELDLLLEQKKNLQGAQVTEYEAKVRALYEVLPAWDKAAHSAPRILARLQSLKDVADVGSSASAALSSLEKSSASTDSALREAQAALDKVSASLNTSVASMQTHVTTLETKFDAAAAKHGR